MPPTEKEITLTAQTPAGSKSALVALAPKLEALDKFAEANSLSILTEGKGAFMAAISVADAINQLKEMLTPDVMKPILALQGSALGFKTDKDKDGGYGAEVIRDVFIEATLKGFKMVGNQSNIIGGRFYATKEGFEDFFLRQGRAGKFTDFRDAYSIPKVVGEEAIVTASASWKWNGTPDTFSNVQIAIRINKGQGSDAVLGKAKRKLLARIYARVTGTVITEGEAHEVEAIDVTAKKTAQEGATAGTGTVNPPGATEDQKVLLKELLTPHAEKANAWLLSKGYIKAGGSFLDVTEKFAANVLGKSADFLKAIGATE